MKCIIINSAKFLIILIGIVLFSRQYNDSQQNKDKFRGDKRNIQEFLEYILNSNAHCYFNMTDFSL